MKFYCFLVVFFVSFSTFSFGYDWSSNPGDGTAENPFQISEPEHLMSIGSDVNLLDKNFILASDIVFDPNNNPAHVFTTSVIVPDAVALGAPGFRGHFDGNGFNVVNLKIISENPAIGLFGCLLGSGENDVLVENLTLVNPIISGTFHSGSLAGHVEQCKVKNCHAVGGLVSNANGSWMGGLVGGVFYSVIEDCSSSTDVNGVRGIGGLAGSTNSASLVRCRASGNVTGYNDVGGLLGHAIRWRDPEWNYLEEIVDCFATGDVYLEWWNGGGLIGKVATGLVQNCYATGKMTDGNGVGGLIGIIERKDNDYRKIVAKVIGCYATGEAQSQGNFVGGFIGLGEALLVKDSWAKGNAKGYANVGGFIGGCSETAAACCYSIGRVEGVEKTGGFVGDVDYGNIYLCYWNTETSDQSESAGGNEKTTADLKSLNTYRGWGDGVWVLDEGAYPRLSWEGTAGTPIVDVQAYSGGSGTAEDPYRIATASDLISLGRFNGDWDSNFVLVNDIVLESSVISGQDMLYENSNFNKIGIFGMPFRGYFNGNFHSIKNLRNLNDGCYIGLFGAIEGNGPEDVVVENLIIDSPEFLAYSYVGSLVGKLENAKVSRCGVKNLKIYGDLGPHDVGGLIGIAYNCSMTMSFAEGTITPGDISFENDNGGLFGYARSSSVENCYAITAFNIDSSNQAASFIGGGSGCEVRNCYAVPTNTSYYSIVGFIGSSSHNLYNCFYRECNENWSFEGSFSMSESSMKVSGNFSGWDFVGESGNGDNEIWRMCVDGVDYPRLSWEFAKDGDFACGDGVDVLDLQVLAENWLTSKAGTPDEFNYSCDGNGDEQINMKDFEILSSN